MSVEDIGIVRHATRRSPWSWIPSLYFAQAIPYVVVMTVSVILYKRMGISNTDIALYTSWLYLPWVIKPLWSPLVDIFRTKRFWIITLQLLVGASLASVALTIPMPSFFQYTLAVFWLMAFSSATHDIAADGFYMLGLEQHQQAAFVGVRSTFYRIATLTGQGLLVILAGLVESATGMPPVDLAVRANPAAPADVSPMPVVPEMVPEAGELRLVAWPTALEISTTPRTTEETASIVAEARAANVANRFYELEEHLAVDKDQRPSLWQRVMVQPLEGFLRRNFGRPEVALIDRTGNVGLVALHLSRPPEPGQEVVVNLGRKTGDASIALVEGLRLVFTEHNWDQPALAVFQLDPKLRTSAHAEFAATSGNIPLAWSMVFLVLAVMFLVFCIYHWFILPRPPTDRAAVSKGSGVLAEFIRTFVLFFRKREIVVILAFLLLYRFAEAQLVKLATPFMLDPRELGGLGLTTGQVGFVYGTVGIICLTIGGLLGGFVVSRHGLRFWLWPMVLAIHLPDLVYVYLSHAQPDNFLLINLAVGVEMFGYGFGFTAYLLYMIMVADGEHKTAHYAICTGFMALGMMVPGMFSGWVQEIVGYQNFFIWVMLATIPSFLVAMLIRIDPGFGKKRVA